MQLWFTVMVVISGVCERWAYPVPLTIPSTAVKYFKTWCQPTGLPPRWSVTRCNILLVPDRLLHYVNTHVVWRKDVFLFNDALNTFYFMAKWHQNQCKKNYFLICTNPDRTTKHTNCYKTNNNKTCLHYILILMSEVKKITHDRNY